MAYKIFLVVCCVTSLVTCEGRRGRDRKPKFISFDSSKNDIDVSLDFTIPFLSIPIRNTGNSMYDGIPGSIIPKINLNPTAVVFGGVIVLASTLLPLFLKSFSYDTNGYYRILDNEGTASNIVSDFANQFMSESSGCPPRLACWISQRYNDLTPTKTVEDIIRNQFVSSIFNTTIIEDAIVKGRRGDDCAIYKPCSIREEHLSVIMKNLDILTTKKFN